MNCRFLWINEDGFAACDCALPKAGGQINDHGTCDPELCEIPYSARLYT